MPHTIGFVTDAGDFAHCNLIDAIRTFATANGWTVVRNVSSAGARELILKGVGISGTDEIYIGYKTYTNVPAVAYNIWAQVMTGYTPGNTFENQPGAIKTSILCTPERIDYWITLNAQRIIVIGKLSVGYYEHLYLGKFTPYGRPGEYAYPVIAGGCAAAEATISFSVNTFAHNVYLQNGLVASQGYTVNGRVRDAAGQDIAVLPLPFNGSFDGPSWFIPNGGKYIVMPVTLQTAVLQGSNTVVTDTIGELDGVLAIPGSAVAPESTVALADGNYIAFLNVFRSAIDDFHLVRMD